VRKDWTRATPVLELSTRQLEKLISAAFPGQRVVERQYTDGGLANTTISLKLSPIDTTVLLRIFTRDPAQAKKEYALSKLVDTVVPTPNVIYFSPSNKFTGHPYMIREWIEGDRLEIEAPKLKPQEVVSLGRSVGATLASIHKITFKDFGFFDQDLNIATQIDPGSAGLIDFVHKSLIIEKGGERLGAALTTKLIDFVASEGRLLDEWKGSPCLTHCDFGGSNILVRGSADGWKIVAVLDWEFAFSGTPFFDFGNLLRSPLGDLESFPDSVQAGYKEAGGTLPASWRKMSLLADLYAWMDFLSRPDTGPELIADAQSVITDMLATW
jgi:aminoglycoside phosphotransferase (APT) family kinase protein